VVRWLWNLHELPHSTKVIVDLALVCLVVWIDTLSVHSMNVVFLYLVPAGLAAWAGGYIHGIAASVFCGLMVVTSGYISGAYPGGPVGVGWNVASLVLMLLLFSSLVAAISRILKYEQGSAHTDPLTGLANRRLLNEYFKGEVERARRYKRPISIMYIDIDNFKAVNDRFGHAAGDRMLKGMAWILVKSTRKADTPARIGGDEFALILPETMENGVRSVEKRIREKFMALAKRYRWPVGLSIGAAVSAKPGGSIDALLEKADGLLYQVKGAGKGATRIISVR